MPRINLGTVDRAHIEQARNVLKSLGSRGRMTIDPADGQRVCKVDLGSGASLEFSAPYTFDYQIDGDICRITFDDQLKVRWRFLRVNVSEVVVNGHQILIQAGVFHGICDIR